MLFLKEPITSGWLRETRGFGNFKILNASQSRDHRTVRFGVHDVVAAPCSLVVSTVRLDPPPFKDNSQNDHIVSSYLCFEVNISDIALQLLTHIPSASSRGRDYSN